MAESVLPEGMFPLVWPLSLLTVFFCVCTDGLLKKTAVAWFISYPLTDLFFHSLEVQLEQNTINFHTGQSCLFGRWNKRPIV